MNQRVRDAFEKKLDNYDQLKSVAQTNLNKRECSIHKWVNHIARVSLRKTKPGVIFVNSDIPQKSFQIRLSENKISELPGDSKKKIFKQNIMDRYMDRQNLTSFGGRFSQLDWFCLAEFIGYCYLSQYSKYNENGYQTKEHPDEVVESSHNIEHKYPRYIPLLSSKEKCHKITFVLQFPVPNKVTQPEEYAHHLLFMYYPVRDEKLKSDNPATYCNKFIDPGVIDIINENRALVEPFAQE